MEGETNQDDSFPSSNVDRLASDGGSNVSTASRSLTTSSSASSSDQPSSSSGIGRLLSGRFTFKSNQLVTKLLQNSVHFRVGGIDSRSLSISLHVRCAFF